MELTNNEIRGQVPPLEGDRGRENSQNTYNKKLKQFAREHRNNSTKAEIKLWTEVLKAKKLFGFSFKRQRPIGNYIADFYCQKLNLVIEVDGYSHHFDEVLEKDKAKTDFLKKLSITVLRFTDNEVLNEINNIHLCLEQYVNEFTENEIQNKANTLPLTPSMRGK
jgi:very-short-patch-repair endonuclease